VWGVRLVWCMVGTGWGRVEGEGGHGYVWGLCPLVVWCGYVYMYVKGCVCIVGFSLSRIRTGGLYTAGKYAIGGSCVCGCICGCGGWGWVGGLWLWLLLVCVYVVGRWWWGWVFSL